MKMFKKLFTSLFLVSLMAAGMTACDIPGTSDGSSESASSNSEVVTPPTYTLTLTADKTVATPGEQVTLTAVLMADDEAVEADDVEYEIIDGATSATLKNNVLTISATAKANAVIKVWAKIGATKSDIVEITVNVPLESISASANNVTNIESGDFVILNKTITPANADASAFEWVILEGADLCAITGDILAVNTGVATGSTIKVQGKLGDKLTETLTFTVGYPVESLTASADATNVASGEKVILSKTVTPANADLSAFEWVILEGADACTISGDVLTVNAGVKTGTQITVQAKAGAVTSDPISITVGYPVESVSISADHANIMSGSSITLSKEILPAKADVSTFEWVILEGSEVCSISGDKLTVNAGVATGTQISVQGQIEGKTSNTLTFTVGYPVETITISANGVTNIVSGGFVFLTKTFAPSNADVADFEWVILEGDEICAIDGDKLTVNENVETGSKIKVQAKVGNKTSDTLTFTVGYPVEKLEVVVNGSTNVPQGASVALAVNPTPSNATNADYVWTFVEGGEYCTIVNNRLTISEDTPLDTEIKFYADGVVDSDIVTLIVNVAIETLAIECNAPANLVKGASYDISLTATPAEASTKHVSWVVNDEAKAYVTIADGKMTVAANTPTGTPVVVKATSGSVSSNELSYVVGIVLNSLTVNMVGSSNVNPGDVRALNVSFNPENATDKDVVWVISEGADVCSIENNVLSVNTGVAIGTKISFFAKVGSVESEPIEVIVGTPIESISISADKTEILRGGSADLSVVINPNNANEAYEWVINNGSEAASIVNGKLVIVDRIDQIGAIIRIQAVSVSGNAESNELTFTVLAKQEDLDRDHQISPTQDEITVDRFESGDAVSLSAAVLYHGQPVEKALTYKIVDGGDFLDIAVNGNVCTFTAKGHGTAFVEIGAEGINTKATVTVNVIMPPEYITLPDVFTGVRGGNFVYSFSKVENLPFVAKPYGTNVCQGIAYTFKAEDGTEGDEVATYADGKITFKKTGKITVTAVSTSGSDKVVSTSYNFDINEGINVSSFEEFQSAAESRTYDGKAPINFVALDKIDGEYKFVPQVVGKESYQTLIVDRLASVEVEGKGLYVNGNHHPIDVSKLRALTKEEVEAGHRALGKAPDSDYFTGALISLPVRSFDSNTYDVKLYNLAIVGNVPVDFAGDIVDGSAKPIGVHLNGIGMGASDTIKDSLGNVTHDFTKTKYNVDIRNIRIEGFCHGLNMTHVVSGLVENITVGNCYIDGIVCRSSILTLRNITLGACGASGIEFAPELCNKAGVNENQNQTITLEGKLEGSANWHGATDTRYFYNYTLMGQKVADIVAGVVGGINDANKIGHIKNSNDQFCFVALLFHQIATGTPNTSQVTYPADIPGGITTVANLPSSGQDTTHQYIMMPVDVPGLGQVGIALFYNVHYQG